MDVTGIDNHELSQLKMVDGTALIQTNRGPIIGIFRQYAYLGQHRSIHSSGQMEYYKTKVDDRSMRVHGKQCIRTNEGYVIPLDFINGLPYMQMRPNTTKEYDELPHIFFTGAEWNPKVLDNILSEQDDWYNIVKELDDGIMITPFDEYGQYKKRSLVNHTVDTTDQLVKEPSSESDKMLSDDESDSDSEHGEHINLHECYHIMSNLNERYVLEHESLISEDDDSTPSIEAKKAVEVKETPIDYEKYKPYFLHVPTEKIRQTFKNTTQNAVGIMSGAKIQQTHKSPYPAHNVRRRNEPVATDTIFSATPALLTGQTMAQVYVGRKSMVIDIHGMNSEKEFVNTLEDQIRKRGAMNKLLSDSAAVEISKRVNDILRALLIPSWQSEPQYQHQNPAEWRWKHVKRNSNWYMNTRNVPPEAWLLCMTWIADVMNHTSEKSLNWKPPLQVLTGETIDISIILTFLFWDVVYVQRYPDTKYSGQVGSEKSSEVRGRFVGFAWDVGHALTFKILTDDSKRIIHRSQVRLAKAGENNLKLDVEAGEVPERIYITSQRSDSPDTKLPTLDLSKVPFTLQEDETDLASEPPTDDEDDPSPMDDPELPDMPSVDGPNNDEDNMPKHLRPTKPGETRDLSWERMDTNYPTEPGLPPEELVDRSFLMPEDEYGERYRAKITELLSDHKKDLESHPERIRFKCVVNDKWEEIVAYNDIVDYIEKDGTWGEGIWRFKEILDHKFVKPTDPDYKGSGVNLRVRWEDSSVTWEPITTVLDTATSSVAEYAKKHGLLETPGFKRKAITKAAKSIKHLKRLANQAKLHSFRTKPVYMYGFQVPRNYQQALDLDKENGNTKWQDAVAMEMNQVNEYDTFIDKGIGFRPGTDWKRINVHLVFAVKHDGRHKARLVAGGHLTDTPIDSVYSSVVSLRGIRMLTFLAELNDMECWCTDVGNAYLESYTKERVFIVAGAEFGPLAGHTLVIQKALYGLKSSGLRWHERFADVLRSMGFVLSKADSDIWMRDCGDHYEYVGVYVDDLIIVSRNASDITKTLETTHSFKLKGTGPISFHLGCDFYREEDGTLCYAPRKYIDKILDNYTRIFGSMPRPAASPLFPNDHPELDTSDLLDFEMTKIYQSLIGSLQWVIQIGRFDITTHVMTMSRFRAAPRHGHMDRVKRIFGYLRKMKYGATKIRTEEPDYSDIPEKLYDWEHTAYHGVTEAIPDDAPKPLGKPIVQTHYVDANLYHDLVSGRSVTGILHMWNGTPIDWYSKLQTTVETATFGSEFSATRTCSEHIIDLRTTARYLGIPIKGTSMMFGDNETVVNASSMPHSKLHKRHNALAFHKTREGVAAKIFRYTHIPGADNPADILSKHWAMPSVWSQIRPLLFWKGDMYTKTAPASEDPADDAVLPTPASSFTLPADKEESAG